MKDKLIKMKDVEKFNPCYLGRYAPTGWEMHMSEILRLEKSPASDRIWLILRFMEPNDLRDFAWRCAFFGANYYANAASAASANDVDAAAAARGNYR